jgi:hypothetical protein
MTEQRLSRLLDKLCQLKEIDPGLSFFGASEHRDELHPPLAETTLLAFEEKHGVTLPAQYRDFLRQADDGGAGPYYGLYPLRFAYEQMGWVRPGDIRRPFPLDRPWNEYGRPAEQYHLPDGADVHDGCLMLSHHGCGYWSFLIVTGPERGKVWDDFTTADEGLQPTGRDFYNWYEWWLDLGLRREMWFSISEGPS